METFSKAQVWVSSGLFFHRCCLEFYHRATLLRIVTVARVTVKIDGSGTVFPTITEAVADGFHEKNPGD